MKKELMAMDEKATSGRRSGKTKFVERLGRTVGQQLTNPYPWQTDEECSRPNCPPCKEKKGKCKTRNMVYSISCQTCQEVDKKISHYIGETHRTFFDRSIEHLKGLESRTESNALFKHWQIYHKELQEPPDFRFKCLKTFKTSTERQVAEAVFIENLPCDIIMNSKAEYRHNSLIRHRIEFKGVIWQDNLPESKTDPITLPEPKDNNEVSLLHKQFKQRKMQEVH